MEPLPLYSTAWVGSNPAGASRWAVMRGAIVVLEVLDYDAALDVAAALDLAHFLRTGPPISSIDLQMLEMLKTPRQIVPG